MNYAVIGPESSDGTGVRSRCSSQIVHACIQQISNHHVIHNAREMYDSATRRYTRRALALRTRRVCTRYILSHRVVYAQLISPAIAMPAVDVQAKLCCGWCPGHERCASSKVATSANLVRSGHIQVLWICTRDGARGKWFRTTRWDRCAISF